MLNLKHEPIDVLFAYGAGDRGETQAVAFGKALAEFAGLECRPESLLWQAPNADVTGDRSRWISEGRFPEEGSADFSRWADPWDDMFQQKVRQWSAKIRDPRDSGQATIKERGASRLLSILGPKGVSEARSFAVSSYKRFTASTLQVASDVFAYVRNADEFYGDVADRIRQFAASSGRPKVLAGLSLGGIMLVDVLARMTRTEGRPAIDLLLTAGSQAPYLYVIGALPNIDRTDASPTLFLPWVNHWNPNDLLSFPARPAFGSFADDSSDSRRFIRDYQNTVPAWFPAVHSLYFGHERVVASSVRRALEDLGRIPRNPAFYDVHEILGQDR
jgi:hypothetical protein